MVVSASRISVISYGKERPVDSGSNPLWLGQKIEDQLQLKLIKL